MRFTMKNDKLVHYKILTQIFPVLILTHKLGRLLQFCKHQTRLPECLNVHVNVCSVNLQITPWDFNSEVISCVVDEH